MGFGAVVSAQHLAVVPELVANLGTSILWTALFGIFGKIYIPDHPTPEQGGQRRMKSAVWVDLINMLLWLVTCIYGIVIWMRRRNNTTLHTGRAHV